MAATTDMPAVGEKAPSFEGTTQTGETLRLDDFRGQKVALYFYPKNHTSGCTEQACNLRDNYEKLLEAGIAVIGVSQDDVESHVSFAEEYELPFPLVADPDLTILNLYGVWGERQMFGRTYEGTHRTTFLIDEEGIIQHIIKRPNVSNHTAEVLEKFGV